jgi:hypothetical protein
LSSCAKLTTVVGSAGPDITIQARRAATVRSKAAQAAAAGSMREAGPQICRPPPLGPAAAYVPVHLPTTSHSFSTCAVAVALHIASASVFDPTPAPRCCR